MDEEIQETVGMNMARLIISTMPEFKDNIALLALAKRSKKKPRVIVTADDEYSAMELYKKGADYVIVPHYIGGREIAEIVSKDTASGALKKLKAKDIKAFRL